MNTVYLVRHFKAFSNLSMFKGWKNAPLIFFRVAEKRNANVLKENSINRIYCSPLRRTKQTAIKLFGRYDFCVKSFEEIDFSKSLDEQNKGIQEEFAKLLNKNKKPFVIVAHKGVIHSILKKYSLDIPNIGTGKIIKLQINGKNVKMELLN